MTWLIQSFPPQHVEQGQSFSNFGHHTTSLTFPITPHQKTAVKIILKYCIQNQIVELPLDFTTHFCKRKLLLSRDSSFFEEEYPLV